MGRRYTQEEVEKIFEQKGCVLLSKYINSHTLVEYICKCGNIGKINLYHFRCNKYLCRNCFLEGHKHSYEYVSQFFRDNGCILLDKEYIHSKVKMSYICLCGDEYKIRFDSFKDGQRCMQCGNKKHAGKNSPNWWTDRIQLRLNQKLSKRYRGMVRNYLFKTKNEKLDSTHIILGYSAKDLKYHIENHPNWDKVKNKNWHIDHIFPIKAFIDYGLTDIKYSKIINGLDNLQPLLAQDNKIKNDKYNCEKFELYLIEKGIL